MKPNKVYLNDEILLDLTQDTAVEEDVLEGKTFHKADGSIATGTAKIGGDSPEASVLKGLIEGTLTEISNSDVTNVECGFKKHSELTSVDFPNATKIGDEAFYGCSKLTSINFPNVTIIGAKAFWECARLTSANFPNVTTLYYDAFYNCYHLTSVNFPNVTSLGSRVFYSCDSLTSVIFPKATSISSNVFENSNNLVSVDFPNATSIGYMAFASCNALTSVNAPKVTKLSNSSFFCCYGLTSLDLPKVTSMGKQEFYQCFSLRSLILRSTTQCTLSNTNSFSSCYHFDGTVNSIYNPNGDKDGYIYVPSALVDSYKSATNWSTLASQFRALEDYTVDGTITGELDPNKI